MPPHERLGADDCENIQDGEPAVVIRQQEPALRRVAAEARAKLEEFVQRRTKLAEAKIGRAEAQALADVRATAADVAVAAAESILRETAKGQVGDNLVARGIADLKAKLIRNSP